MSPTQEFVVIGGSDRDLWGDIDGPEDDAWAAAINAGLTRAAPPAAAESARLATMAEFTAAIFLHYGPGPHSDGTPQSIHGGGATKTAPGVAARPAPTAGPPATGAKRAPIPGGPQAAQPAKITFIEKGEPGQLQARLKAGGFTYQPVANSAPRDGFMVSPYPEREYQLPADQVTPRGIREYLKKNADLLTKPDHFIGGWVSGGQAYIDVSIRAGDRATAQALAKQHKQLAFFDLAQGATVNANA